MIRLNRTALLLFVAAILAISAVADRAFAAAPGWMPGFPMRMGSNVMLMWMPVPGATGYNIYKSEKDGDIGVKLVSISMNNHMDIGVPSDKNAYYTIKAVVGGGESEASQVGKIVGIKPLDAPTWQGFMPGSDEGQVAVRFSMVGGATFYNLYRSENKDGPFSILGSIQDTKYTDSSLQVGKKYYYVVSAVDQSSVESPKSPVLEVELTKKVQQKSAKAYELKLQKMAFGGYFFGSKDPVRTFNTPAWLTSDRTSDKFFVADLIGVAAFDINQNLLFEIVKPENYKDEWGMLRCINLSSDGQYLLASFINPAVVRLFDPANGEYLAEFQMVKPTKEEYAALNRLADWEEDKDMSPSPFGVATDAKGNIWVTDVAFKQLHIYNASGELIKKIGEPKVRKPEEKDFLGLGQLRFHAPTGRVYALSPLDYMIRAFSAADMDFIKDKEGNIFYGWKVGGNSPGQFQEARGFDVLPDGSLVVVDGIDGRVQVMTPEMEYVHTLTTNPDNKKPYSNQFPAAQTVTVVGKKLVITDTMQNRLVFTDY